MSRCPICNGTGEEWVGEDIEDCPACKGTGIEQEDPKPPPPPLVKGWKDVRYTDGR